MCVSCQNLPPSPQRVLRLNGRELLFGEARPRTNYPTFRRWWQREKVDFFFTYHGNQYRRFARPGPLDFQAGRDRSEARNLR